MKFCAGLHNGRLQMSLDPRIRLVALDLDGTLLDSSKKAPEDFVPWVKAHPDVIMVLASGRQYYNLYALFPEIAANLMYIAENGAVVFYKSEVLSANEIAPRDLQKIVSALVKDASLHLVLCGVGGAYTLSGDETAISNAMLYYKKLEVVDSFDAVFSKDRIVKIAVFVHERRADAFYNSNMAADLLDGTGLIKVLSGVDWVDMQNASVGKGEALKSVQKMFGIDRTGCMAFGDYLNDMTLLQACEESYCMENGLPELKAVAKYIAPSCDDNGVMKILNRVFG